MDIISVSCRIRGRDLDPAAMTRLLGVEPTKSHHAGDPLVVRATGLTAGEFHEGQWSLECEEGKDVEGRVNYLLDRLEQRLSELTDAVPYEIHVDILIGVFLEEGLGGFVLGSDCLRRLAGLGITLDIDMYS